ncbi:unnamed protein product, partial [Prorocentrum cordatum]
AGDPRMGDAGVVGRFSAVHAQAARLAAVPRGSTAGPARAGLMSSWRVADTARQMDEHCGAGPDIGSASARASNSAAGMRQLGASSRLSARSAVEARGFAAPVGGAVAWGRKLRGRALELAEGLDGRGLISGASLELAARLVEQIERAMRARPKAPCFEGLLRMMERVQGERGRAQTREFTARAPWQAVVKVRVIEQNWLRREELEAKRKDRDKNRKGDE